MHTITINFQLHDYHKANLYIFKQESTYPTKKCKDQKKNAGHLAFRFSPFLLNLSAKIQPFKIYASKKGKAAQESG